MIPFMFGSYIVNDEADLVVALDFDFHRGCFANYDMSAAD